MVGIRWIDDESVVVDVFLLFFKLFECCVFVFVDYYVGIEWIDLVKDMWIGDDFLVVLGVVVVVFVLFCLGFVMIVGLKEVVLIIGCFDEGIDYIWINGWNG